MRAVVWLLALVVFAVAVDALAAALWVGVRMTRTRNTWPARLVCVGVGALAGFVGVLCLLSAGTLVF
jgi:hypothetical protein